MITALIAIVFWSLCLPMLYVLGGTVGSHLGEHNKIVDGVFLIALGWAIFAYFLVILGVLQCLSLLPVLAFIATVLLLCRKKLSDFVEWMRSVIALFDLGLRIGTAGWYIRLVFSLSLLLTFAFCMLPASSNDGLAYQLNIPKLFLQQSSIAPIEYELRSYRSLLQNVLYTAGLMLENVPIAKLFHWITGVLLVFSVSALVEQKTADRDLGIFSGALLWFTPTLINQITTTYVDAGVTLYVFLSIYLLIENPKQSKATYLYSGLLMGIAVSIKYMAVTACVAASGYFLWQTLRRRFAREEFFNSMLWGICVLIGCGFWFFRSWAVTGNPVYPHFAEWFNQDSSFEELFYFYDLQGLQRTWLNYILILWNMTFQPAEFDYHHWIGPAYLVLSPLVIYGAYKERKNSSYLAFVWLLITVWFFTAQLSRYLLPAFPFYIILAVHGIYTLQRRFRNRTVSALVRIPVVALLAFLFVLSLYHFRIQFLPILRIWSADQYLKFTERTAGIAKWVNGHLPNNAKVLIRGEVRPYYFDRSTVLEEFFSFITKYQEGKSPAEIAAWLKGEGFTHVLDGVSMPLGAIATKTKFDLLIQDPELTRKLFTMISENGREPKFIYNVYELL